MRGMDKSGKQLEKLVQEIEQHLLPHGFTVEPRKQIYNRAGTQIAELDLVITGTIGSSSIFWLIECRDRPSDGPAPGAWIEQLVGRRERFNIDKVFAVSTTGFAEGARQYAEEKGIVLRTVEDITDIASDFTIDVITHVVTSLKLTGGVHIQTSNPDDVRRLTITNAKFKKPCDRDYKVLQDFVLDILEPKLFGKKDFLLDHIFEYKQPLSMLSDQEEFDINYLRIPVRITIRTYESKVLAAKKYAEGDRIIGAEGTTEVTTPSGKIKVRAQVFNRPDGTKDYKVFLPENLPSGWYTSYVSLDDRTVKIQSPHTLNDPTAK